MVFQYSYTSTHTLRLPMHGSSWMVLNRALQPQGCTGDPRVHPPEIVFTLIVFIILKFIRANPDNFRKRTSVYHLYYSEHKNCLSSSLYRISALYWLYNFLGFILNMILLNNFATCHSRIFDFWLVIALDQIVFYFIRNRYNWHNFCSLWFTEHRLRRSLCYLSKIITSSIPVPVASSKTCEIKSWN